ncbi:hypothetical protein L0F63_005441, partial [Massospora cicadina]
MSPSQTVDRIDSVHQLHRASILFSISDRVGALDECLVILKNLDISMTRIESRPSMVDNSVYDFFVDLSSSEDIQIANAVELPKKLMSIPSIWFPRKKSDLDSFAEKVLEMGEELASDHPGAHDAAYRKRRAEITQIAKTYRSSGHPINHRVYGAGDSYLVAKVYTRLTELFKSHACREHLHVFPLLERNCGYGPNRIPQLETVSRFLKECTGFTLKPVMGLLTSRDFLNGLAFRVFHSTQYIRHHSKPLYTPEPDVCHELLGHVPLFANPDFADFSQEIGLASLGASDEDIERLSTIYWFTVEFGLCKQGGDIKAYGAGVLSSFGEMEYALSGKPEKRPFDAKLAALTKYPITEYQPVYYVAESFQDAKEKVREFADSLSRPFHVRYNPYTETIEILDTREKLTSFARAIKNDFGKL